jgi:uncharacterized protein (DUF697 family)
MRRLRTVRARAPIPTDPIAVTEIARRCRRTVKRRALVSAAAAVVPVPGLDLAIDVGLLLRLVDEINAAFGLTPAQIDALSPRAKAYAYQAITMVGSALIGRVVTRELVLLLLGRVGIRLSAGQAARLIPLAGQALSASLSFGALTYLGNRHIEDCERVVRQIQLEMQADVVA